MTSGPHPQPRPDRLLAQRNRAAAFARIARVRGASVVGAGALTAALAALVSAIAPGHTLGAKLRPRIVASTRSVPTGRPAAAASTALPPLASPGQLGLSAPGSAPSAPVPTQPSASTQQAAAQQAAQAAAAQQAAAAATQQAAPVVSGGS